MTDQTGSSRTKAGRALLRAYAKSGLPIRVDEILAIESEAQSLSGEREGIDVERLTRAIGAVKWLNDNGEIARTIAREYNRLASLPVTLSGEQVAQLQRQLLDMVDPTTGILTIESMPDLLPGGDPEPSGEPGEPQP